MISTCPNSNFNLGNFKNWKGTYGSWSFPNQYNGLDTNTVAPYPNGDFQCYGVPDSTDCPPLYSIIPGPGKPDPNTGDSLYSVFHEEAYSAKLGHNVGGSHVATLKYDVYVDASTYLLIYRYAVVLQNPGHPFNEQPSFQIAIEDSTGKIVDSTCGYYYIYCNDTALGPGWHKHLGSDGTPIEWKEWTTVGMSLQKFVGRHLSIVYTTKDCEPGGHFGYAYVSAYCSSLTIQTSMCQGDTSATLTAPLGFAHYHWSTGDTVRQIVVPHPITGETIDCILTAVNGCVDTIHETLTYTVITTNFYHGAACSGINTQFYDSSQVNQNAVTGWDWNFGDGTPVVTGIPNPTHVFALPGIYQVTLVSNSTEGCKDSISKPVVVDTLPTINNSVHREQICSGQSTNIALTANVANPLFTWTAVSSSVTLTGSSNDSVPVSGPINQTLINNGTHIDSVTYTIFPYKGSCEGPAFTYVVVVKPLPTANIAGTIAVCQNAIAPLVTFTGVIGISPFKFTYNINGGANQQVTTTVGNSVTVAAPTNTVGTFTYNLVSVQDGGSTFCSQLQTGSAIITVNPLPTATISGTTAVCQNSASPLITFTGASSTAPYSFTYNINGGAHLQVTTTVGNSVTVSAPTNTVGTFTYNLISVQDGSPTACSQPQTGSAIVTVNALPTATISGTTAVCQNATAPLVTFTGGTTTAPYTFTYKINAGANQQVTTTVGNSVTVAAPTNTVGTFTYTLISVQDGTPTACSQLQSGNAVITVNPLPTATISGTTAVCQNSASPLITFTGASSTAPYTFTYNINGGANQQVTTTVGNSVTVAAPTNTVGTFTYNLLSVRDGSPTSCSQLQSGSAVITVNALPTATISGTTAVCQNAVAPLVTFTGGTTTPPYTFTYNINGGANQQVTTTVGNSVTVAAPTNTVGTFTYNLISVRDGSSTTCFQLQTGTAVITVNALPTATISGTTAVCQNSASPLVTFRGGTTMAPYTFTYNINGGANLQVTTTVGNSVTVAAPTNTVGTFTYNLISVQDGSPTACSQLQTGSAIITVNPLPTATISGTTAVCQNSASPLITFTGASSTAPYTFTYNINS
ncbi:MAG: PKD domain-containing protein, partial [Bacteroidales bacterium]